MSKGIVIFKSTGNAAKDRRTATLALKNIKRSADALEKAMQQKRREELGEALL